MFIKINKLTEIEFQDTFSSPMKYIKENGESSGVNLSKYIQRIIKKEKFAITIKDIEIHYVYQTSDDKFEHVLFYYGIKELYLVIVIDLFTRKVFGYHLLDLIEKYTSY